MAMTHARLISRPCPRPGPRAPTTQRRRAGRLWILGLMGLCVCLGGCAATAVGAGVVAAGAAMQERTMGDAVDDTRIRVAINERWLSYSEAMVHPLDMMVQEGRVLLVGIVPRADWKAQAVALAQSVEGVREVIDEIELGPGRSLQESLSDQRIASAFNIRLVGNPIINPLNYSFEVINGRLFMIGIASSGPELEQALLEARGIRGVSEVISYVRVVPASQRLSPSSDPAPSVPDQDSTPR